jgi:hypothetical protein
VAPDNILIQTVLVPGAVAMLAAGLLWFIGGADRGYAAAAGAIGIGFIAGYLVIRPCKSCFTSSPVAPPLASCWI